MHAYYIISIRRDSKNNISKVIMVRYKYWCKGLTGVYNVSEVLERLVYGYPVFTGRMNPEPGSSRRISHGHKVVEDPNHPGHITTLENITTEYALENLPSF